MPAVIHEEAAAKWSDKGFSVQGKTHKSATFRRAMYAIKLRQIYSKDSADEMARKLNARTLAEICEWDDDRSIPTPDAWRVSDDPDEGGVVIELVEVENCTNRSPSDMATRYFSLAVWFDAFEPTTIIVYIDRSPKGHTTPVAFPVHAHDESEWSIAVCRDLAVSRGAVYEPIP